MKLRKWQSEAFKIWWQEKKGIIKVVTGGGKTFLQYIALKIFRKIS